MASWERSFAKVALATAAQPGASQKQVLKEVFRLLADVLTGDLEQWKKEVDLMQVAYYIGSIFLDII